MNDHFGAARAALDGCDVAPGELDALARAPHLHPDLRGALSRT